MKNALKKVMLVFTAAALSFSAVSCGESSEKENLKSSSNSPEKAVQNFLQGILDADADEVCKAMAPEELWDYVCKDTGLSKEKILQRFLGRDTLEDFSKDFNEIGVEASDIIIDDKRDENDNGYHAFAQAMSNADIDENINHLYYVETGPYRAPFYDMDGWAYEIDNNWYFGSEWLLEDLIEVAIEGYAALPDEYYQENYEDDYYYDYDYNNSYDTSYEDDNSYNEKTETTTTKNNSAPESNTVNFCADLSNWVSFTSEEDNCVATMKLLSNGAALEVTKTANGYYYYTQLAYNNVALEKNATYRLEFDYEATEDLSIEFRIQQNYEPYSGYDGEIFDALANGKKHYSIQFTMPVSDDDMSIVFNCNNPGVALPYTFTVTNLTLVSVA